jgi:hypothetical protein
VLCSGLQGRDPVSESLTVSIDRFGHVAIPQFVGVTPCSLRGVNGLAAERGIPSTVGATGGPSKHGSLNIKE